MGVCVRDDPPIRCARSLKCRDRGVRQLVRGEALESLEVASRPRLHPCWIATKEYLQLNGECDIHLAQDIVDRELHQKVIKTCSKLMYLDKPGCD